MNDTMQLTPEKLVSICSRYGLNDAEGLQKLWLLATVFLYNNADLDEHLKKEHLFRKELATMTNIFKNGSRITIEATMPKGNKDEHTILHIETNGLLQQKIFPFLESMLAKYHYEVLGVTEKKNEGHFTDEELEGIVTFEEKLSTYRKGMMGYAEKKRPQSGSIVHCFIGAGAEVLASLTQTEKYCLIGDIMLAAGVSPVEQSEWDEVLTNKEKADKVKSWEASYLNQQKKLPI